MSSQRNCWLLLEKSNETRISKGIDGYRDKTGEVYNYDSLVPNHKRLNSGDLVIIRKEDTIVGCGQVGKIDPTDTEKSHRRCPSCGSTDIRERKTLTPRWKCGKCSEEFASPIETSTDVTVFNAHIKFFTYLEKPPTVRDVKACAVGEAGVRSQLSILDLNIGKLISVLGDVDLSSPWKRAGSSSGQGFGFSAPERKAIELRAMEVVKTHYREQGWELVDRSANSPFDLLALKDETKRYIEVKGTVGDGSNVILTHGEVTHARSNPDESVLVVVAEIALDGTGEELRAMGGRTICHLDPWDIDDALLSPTEFRYRTPVS